MAQTKYKLTFLGTGSAFTIGSENYHSNLLLENSEGDRLLIDCGSDVRHSLHHLDLGYQDIHEVYVSHLHADHIGGLEWLGLRRFFDPACHSPTLYISPELKHDLWEHSLAGGMRTLEGRKADLETFFNVVLADSANQFNWHGVVFTLIQTVHIFNGDHLAPCFGLWFALGDKRIFFTADTQYTFEKFAEYYKTADCIFHDCETSSDKSGVHARYEDLVKLPIEIKKKMWLYHYNPGVLPDAKKDGFAGFVECQQVFCF